MAGARYSGRVWTALATVYVVWGSTYLAIKWGVATFPPFVMLAIRFLLAGGLLFLWCSRRGWPRTTRRQWLAMGVVGICLAGIGNGGVAFAETRIDSGLAALIVAIIPLWVALLERVALGRRLSARGVAGIAIGLAGVAFLLDPSGTSTRDLIACLVVVVGSFCWASGSIYATRAARPADPLLAAAMQMLVAGAVLCAVAGPQWGRFHPGAVSTRSALSVLYLILIGSVVAYSAYGWALLHAPTSLVATYAYVNPVVAVLLGALLAHESITVHTLAGGAAIVVAVALIVSSKPQVAREEQAVEPVRQAA
jgi:drug/metabolite transporter (DMT)-like permease